MEVPYDYQLAVADYWEGRPTMEPTAWVPGLPLQMTVAAPASNTDLVVSSTGQQQLVQKSDDHHQHAVELFKEAAHSIKYEVDKMETKMHLFPPSMRDLAKLYATPKVVAIGPYHHGKTAELRQMESTKHAAASHFIEESGLSIEEVYGAVCAVAEQARSYYDAGRLLNCGDDEFKPMMFFDGCFLLQYMLFWCRENDGDVDPSMRSIFSSNDRPIFCDVVLLENQLPWVVLDTLINLMPTDTPLSLATFVTSVKIDKLHTRQVLSFHPPPLDDYVPPHLLGLLRYHIVGNTPVKQTQGISEKVEKVSWSVSVIELAEIGIEVTPNDTKEDLKKMGVDRSGWFAGKLMLSSLSLDDANATFLVNMAAFEMCTTPDFAKAPDEMSAVCSYLCLLGMVTDSENDVQELRNKHILEGGAGLTNEDTLKLFTGVEKHLRPGNLYYNTVVDIEKYKFRRRWWIKLYRFGYRNRNIIIAIVSTIVGLAGFLGTLKSFQ